MSNLEGNYNSDAFARLKISPWTSLKSAERCKCPGCNKSRKYYCGQCLKLLLPIGSNAPNVKLPIMVDVHQTPNEVPQRSTAAHAAITAPQNVKIWRPFPDILDKYFTHIGDSFKKVLLLYPTKDAITVKEAVMEMPELERVVVIDCNWTKSVEVEKVEAFKGLKRVRLSSGEGEKGRMSRFWRYAPVRKNTSPMFNPDMCHKLVSTVEAIYLFCVEYHEAKFAKKYEGAYDDLLWFFSFNYSLVKTVYENAPGKRERLCRKSKNLLSEF